MDPCRAHHSSRFAPHELTPYPVWHSSVFYSLLDLVLQIFWSLILGRSYLHYLRSFGFEIWWAPLWPYLKMVSPIHTPTPWTHMLIIVLLCMDCKLTEHLTRAGWPWTEMVPHTKNDEHDWENIFPKASLETVLKMHNCIIIANSLYSYTSSKFLAHRDFFLKLLTSFFWCFNSLCKIMRLSPKK